MQRKATNSSTLDKIPNRLFTTSGFEKTIDGLLALLQFIYNIKEINFEVKLSFKVIERYLKLLLPASLISSFQIQEKKSNYSNSNYRKCINSEV